MTIYCLPCLSCDTKGDESSQKLNDFCIENRCIHQIVKTTSDKIHAYADGCPKSAAYVSGLVSSRHNRKTRSGVQSIVQCW